MNYSPPGFVLIFGCMTFNLLYFSVSTLHPIFLWRTDAIALAKLNKPPLSNMSPVSISPTSNGLEINKPLGKTILLHLNFTFPLVAHAFSTTSLRVHFKLSLTPVEIFGFSILQDSVFSRSVTFLPRNKLFPSFKNSCLVLKRGQLQNLSCENELKTTQLRQLEIDLLISSCRSSHSRSSCRVLQEFQSQSRWKD